MIADEELQTLFKAESDEHLEQLEQGLLRLEKEPADKETLQAVFREAHSLKGAARMLDMTSIEMVAHSLEDVLRNASRGEVLLAPEQIDRLYAGVDAARKLVVEALTGQPAGVDVAAVVASLAGRQPTPPLPESKPSPAAEEKPPGPGGGDTGGPPERPLQPAAAGAVSVPAAVPEVTAPLTPAALAGSEEYRIDTVRVTTRHLDGLMTRAGELMVTRTHIARRVAEVDELLALWEDWGRETNANRLALRERETGLARLAGIEERHVERLDQLGRGLGRLRNACYDDNARLEDVAERIDRGVRAMRMLPLATILNLFPRMVRDISREQGKDVELVVEGGEIEADKHILEKIKDPLMHLVRNAVDHGIESPEARERDGKSRLGTIWLKCRQGPTHIVIEVQDDGGGLDAEAIKRVAAKRKLCREEELAAMTLQQVHGLVFVSGFSTRPFVTDISGRGVGLDVVRANVEELKGKVEVESSPSSGSLFRLRLPVTLATSRILLAAVGGRTYGLPVDAVQTSLRVDRGALFTVEGRSTLVLQEEAVSVAPLAELLELPPGSPAERPVCVVLGSGADRLGVLVDDVVGEQEVVVKPAGALLKRVRNVSGAAILGSGEICIILSAPDLIRSVRKRGRALPREEGAPEAQRKPVVLLVEDSITTRTQEKRILESAGYEVVAAVDGVEAWEKLGSQSFDAVVSDIEMPHLDGFALTEKIRQEKRHLDLPVILVSTLAGAEDKRKGMEAGANAFLVKSAFDQTVLIETLKRLI